VTDEQLCGLVDWLYAMGCRHTLEVELRLKTIRTGDLGKYDFAKFLPEFGRRGIVTFIHTDGNRFLYSSRLQLQPAIDKLR